VCRCPGTGKSLSMEKVKQCLVDWAKEVKLSYGFRRNGLVYFGLKLCIQLVKFDFMYLDLRKQYVCL
jgi:hypothetical protein